MRADRNLPHACAYAKVHGQSTQLISDSAVVAVASVVQLRLEGRHWPPAQRGAARLFFTLGREIDATITTAAPVIRERVH